MMENEVQKVKTRRARPTGISLIALFLMLAGLALPLDIQILFTKAESFGLRVHNIMYILIYVASLVLAWGLWTVKPWAVRETIGLEIIVIVSAVVWFIILPKPNPALDISSLVISLLFNSLIIYYLLTSKKVREAFQVA